MSLNNYWKLINYLKEVTSKLTSDKSLQNDWLQMINKIPQSQDITEYLKTTEKRISSVQQSAQKLYNSAIQATPIIFNAKPKIQDTPGSWKKINRSNSKVWCQVLALL